MPAAFLSAIAVSQAPSPELNANSLSPFAIMDGMPLPYHPQLTGLGFDQLFD